MLTSGGEPLQLTSDEGQKRIDSFSPDGKDVYFERSVGREEVWAVPTLGGAPRRVVSGWDVVPSPDGAFIVYAKWGSTGILRADKSGLNEELVSSSETADWFFIPLLWFPGGNELLAAGVPVGFGPKFHLYRINVTSHEVVDLGEVTGNSLDLVWAEPGQSILFSRVVNGLTNIWNCSLKDRNLTQITFGTGPDYSPMPDPGGKGGLRECYGEGGAGI
jgi:Tol biopolymer transport system component